MNNTTVITDVLIVDGGAPYRADITLRGGRIERIGPDDGHRSADGVHLVDGDGRIALPGFVDTHSHADGVLFDPAVQHALLRQGVTTVIGGQDGVSYAPGDGAYADEYFAAINGPHPSYRGSTVADLLATYDGATRLNFAYLVPAGTVRQAVMGRSDGAPDAAELARMRELVAAGLADGAVGLSTGLDYVPGLFAGTAELASLCEPVAAADGVYVTHMRGGYEDNSAAGIEEIIDICRPSGARAHVSHFHATPEIVLAHLDALTASGIDATFDAYPYTRGCTLLAMPLLPARLANAPTAEVLAVLGDPAGRQALRAECLPVLRASASLGPDWASMITLAHVAAPEYGWAHGLTLAAAAARTDQGPFDLALNVLAASAMRVNAVMAVPHERGTADLARIFAHPDHMGGSDGIFIGEHPHPRAAGTFARYLSEFVRESGTWDWADAAAHLSFSPAARFGLGRRGKLREGHAADVVLIDPDRVRDTATYDHPRNLAAGIDDVFVAGEHVLASGNLTEPPANNLPADSLPGRGLRRSAERK